MNRPEDIEQSNFVLKIQSHTYNCLLVIKKDWPTYNRSREVIIHFIFNPIKISLIIASQRFPSPPRVHKEFFYQEPQHHKKLRILWQSHNRLIISIKNCKNSIIYWTIKSTSFYFEVQYHTTGCISFKFSSFISKIKLSTIKIICTRIYDVLFNTIPSPIIYKFIPLI